jgi:hypothetical protein
MLVDNSTPMLRIRAWVDIPSTVSSASIDEACALVASRVRFELSKRYRRQRRESQEQRQRERDARIAARREQRELAAKYGASQ